MVRLSAFCRAVRLKGGGTLDLDRLVLSVRGGAGGRGYEKMGGVGGQGGDVYLEAAEKYTLQKMVKQNPSGSYVADRGENSTKYSVLGKKGRDMVITVPRGVTVSADSTPLGELNKNKQTLLVAAGGEGATPENNYVFGKGERLKLQIDLKLIADIGLVGFPNAGKSTLLAALSRAKPKIAAYPFTTLRPQVGIMEYDDLRQISVADLPGLIEGAYKNVGMGHKFLKHVERTSVLLLMIDLTGFQLNLRSPFRTALQTIALLTKELELYNEELLDKPAVLCLNKIDLPESNMKAKEIIKRLKDPEEFNKSMPPGLRTSRALNFLQTFTISARENVSTDHIKEQLRLILDFVDDMKREQSPYLDESQLIQRGTLV